MLNAEKKVLYEKQLEQITKETIEEYYIEKNFSKKMLCEQFHITEYALSLLFKRYNIRKTQEEIKRAREQTNLQRYGESNPSKSSQIKEKIKAVNIKKYGANSFTATEEGKRKIAQTKQERFGDAKYNNLEKGKLTKKVRYNNENYNNRTKYKETMLDRYHIDNGFKMIKTKESKLDSLIQDKNYSPIFRELIVDRDKSINYLKDKNYSYFDISKELNVPYYTIQQWVTRLDLKEYISYTFDGKSHYEDEIVSFLKSLKDNIIIERNTFEYLDGQEIDIYLPEYNLGIEFNGTYWHSDLFKENIYHFGKSLLAEKKNIHLVHIFQYEWDDIITQGKIKNILKIFIHSSVTKIYARNCEVIKLENKQVRSFVEDNHIQGHRNAKITYGLFYDNKLVQILSFSRNKKYSWEIIRSCSLSNIEVVGGLSKLFKAFVKEYNPSSIFSYCDFNKFTGISYENLGMKLIGYTGPDLKYVIKGNVVNRSPHKYKEIKDKIDYRIYGAGSKKYLISF